MKRYYFKITLRKKRVVLSMVYPLRHNHPCSIGGTILELLESCLLTQDQSVLGLWCNALISAANSGHCPCTKALLFFYHFLRVFKVQNEIFFIAESEKAAKISNIVVYRSLYLFKFWSY